MHDLGEVVSGFVIDATGLYAFIAVERRQDLSGRPAKFGVARTLIARCFFGDSQQADKVFAADFGNICFAQTSVTKRRQDLR